MQFGIRFTCIDVQSKLSVQGGQSYWLDNKT